jgi:hypothetical protein
MAIIKAPFGLFRRGAARVRTALSPSRRVRAIEIAFIERLVVSADVSSARTESGAEHIFRRTVHAMHDPGFTSVAEGLAAKVPASADFPQFDDLSSCGGSAERTQSDA